MASPRDASVRIVIQIYSLGLDKHTLLDMPVLSRTTENIVLLPEVCLLLAVLSKLSHPRLSGH